MNGTGSNSGTRSAAKAEGKRRPRVIRHAALLSMPRTGSTMVTRQLATHPEIHFVGAIFSVLGWAGVDRDYRRLQRGLTPDWDHLEYRVAHHRELMDKWFKSGRKTECYGIKHHLSGPSSVTQTLIDDAGIGKILLTRENILACYSSELLARIQADTGTPSAGMKVPFKAREFEKYLAERRKHYDRWRPRLATGPGPWIEIEYTEARQRSGIERLVAFLNLDPQGLAHQRTPKRNADDIVSRFENPSNVYSFLKRHGLEAWEREGTADDGDPPPPVELPSFQVPDNVWDPRAEQTLKRVRQEARRLERRKSIVEVNAGVVGHLVDRVAIPGHGVNRVLQDVGKLLEGLSPPRAPSAGRPTTETEDLLAQLPEGIEALAPRPRVRPRGDVADLIDVLSEDAANAGRNRDGAASKEAGQLFDALQADAAQLADAEEMRAGRDGRVHKDVGALLAALSAEAEGRTRAEHTHKKKGPPPDSAALGKARGGKDHTSTLPSSMAPRRSGANPLAESLEQMQTMLQGSDLRQKRGAPAHPTSGSSSRAKETGNPSTVSRPTPSAATQVKVAPAPSEIEFPGASDEAGAVSILGVINGTIHGWARQPGAGSARIEVVDERGRSRTVSASMDPPTILPCPAAARGHAFSISLWPGWRTLLRSWQTRRLRLRIAGGSAPFRDMTIPGDPHSLEKAGYDGYCDVTVGGIRGWIWQPSAPDRIVDVAVFVDGRFLARCAASTQRADLRAAGIGAGNHGFSLTLPSELKTPGPHNVEVVVADAGLLLKRGRMRLVDGRVIPS